MNSITIAHVIMMSDNSTSPSEFSELLSHKNAKYFPSRKAQGTIMICAIYMKSVKYGSVCPVVSNAYKTQNLMITRMSRTTNFKISLFLYINGLLVDKYSEIPHPSSMRNRLKQMR